MPEDAAQESEKQARTFTITMPKALFGGGGIAGILAAAIYGVPYLNKPDPVLPAQVGIESIATCDCSRELAAQTAELLKIQAHISGLDESVVRLRNEDLSQLRADLLRLSDILSRVRSDVRFHARLLSTSKPVDETPDYDALPAMAPPAHRPHEGSQ